MSLYDPRNRKELYYKGILDQDPGSLPDPQTREEIYLKAIAEHTSKYYGSPLTANIVADMTDKDRVYVYTGSEVGYIAGDWYYWDGSAWTDGGVYNAVVVQTDTTLTQSGVPADAKVTGDRIKDLEDEVNITIDPAGTTTTGSSVIATTTGTVVTGLAAVYASTDFIDISRVAGFRCKIKSLFGTWFGFAIYDTNQTFIAGYNSTTQSVTADAVSDTIITIPANAYYIRFSLRTSYSSDPADYPIISVDTVENMIDAMITANDNEVIKNDFSTMSVFENIGIIGDSFSSGEIYINGTPTDYYNLSWGQIIARKCGVSVVNYSGGGLSTRTWLTNAGRGLPALLADSPKNLYIIALGLNDVTIAGYLGTIADITPDYTQNPDTFYGNYARIIEQVQAHAPGAKIVLTTMPRYLANYTAFDDAIIEIANHYNLPYLVTMNDPFFVSEFYSGGLISYHPTAVLYGGMAEAYQRLFNRACITWRSYFNDYSGS